MCTLLGPLIWRPLDFLKNNTQELGLVLADFIQQGFGPAAPRAAAVKFFKNKLL